MVSLCKSKTLFKHPMTEVLSRYPVKMKGLCRQMSSTSVIFNSRTSLFNQCINDLAIVFQLQFLSFPADFPIPTRVELHSLALVACALLHARHLAAIAAPCTCLSASASAPPCTTLQSQCPLLLFCTKESSLVSSRQWRQPWLWLLARPLLALKADVSCKYEKGTCTKWSLDLRKDL